MTVDERLDRLTAIVESLASSVLVHDRQIAKNSEAIERLQQAIERLQQAIERLREESANLERRWQAYLNTLPRQ